MNQFLRSVADAKDHSDKWDEVASLTSSQMMFKTQITRKKEFFFSVHKRGMQRSKIQCMISWR